MEERKREREREREAEESAPVDVGLDSPHAEQDGAHEHHPPADLLHVGHLREGGREERTGE